MKSDDGISRYAPWEREGKAKKREAKKRGIPLHTSQKVQVKSKPKTADQEFLELYSMAREKERLEKYGKTLGERQRAVAIRWKEVKSNIYHTIRKRPSTTEDGIEESLTNKQKKKIKKKKSGNIQSIDWDY